MFIKFLGLPINVNIGTLFITLAASFDPIATMKGVFNVAPRGTF